MFRQIKVAAGLLILGCASIATAFFVLFIISLALINPERADVRLLADYPLLSPEQIKQNGEFMGQQYGPYARMRYMKCHSDMVARQSHPAECMMLENSVGRRRLTINPWLTAHTSYVGNSPPQ
jgi:hypothetical protein